MLGIILITFIGMASAYAGYTQWGTGWVELVTASAPLDVPNEEEAFRNLKGCVDSLLTSADALYLTYTSTPMDRIPALMAPVLAAGLPSFAQAGPQLVEYGVLMSLAQASFEDIGLFDSLTL